MTVAYQGLPGAFGHAAALAFVPGHEAIAKPGFAAVLAAVASGEADYGVLPVENSVAGPVSEVEHLLRDYRLPMTMHELPIAMHLMARPGTELAMVRRVVSHPIALAQCRATLRAMGLATEEASNTAVAAATLARSGDPETAVLASEAAASAYGLVILRRDVHDRADNVTRFCVLRAPR